MGVGSEKETSGVVDREVLRSCDIVGNSRYRADRRRIEHIIYKAVSTRMSPRGTFYAAAIDEAV